MRRSILFSIACCILFSACSGERKKGNTCADGAFVSEVVVKTTPVKNQGRSSLCWVYAMVATIESERLMMGDSVELSTDYYARMVLMEKARARFFAHRQQSISMRGTGSMLLSLINKYGAMPYAGYSNISPVNYAVLARKTEHIAAAAPLLEALNRRMERLLDENIGYLPASIFMYGTQYTPQEFGRSVCLPGQYLSLTSFTHHPFGQRFVLEVPDNVLRDSFLNIPIDTLMFRVERAIAQGHPVCWEGDTSEPGFDVEAGKADLCPAQYAFFSRRGGISQADRQRAFETGKTTDDHCMELCGLARDRRGRKFFLAKNSYGKTGRYGGFIYLSEAYVRLKTIAFYMSREAWKGHKNLMVAHEKTA